MKLMEANANLADTIDASTKNYPVLKKGGEAKKIKKVTVAKNDTNENSLNDAKEDPSSVAGGSKEKGMKRRKRNCKSKRAGSRKVKI